MKKMFIASVVAAADAALEIATESETVVDVATGTEIEY